MNYYVTIYNFTAIYACDGQENIVSFNNNNQMWTNGVTSRRKQNWKKKIKSSRSYLLYHWRKWCWIYWKSLFGNCGFSLPFQTCNRKIDAVQRKKCTSEFCLKLVECWLLASQRTAHRYRFGSLHFYQFHHWIETK